MEESAANTRESEESSEESAQESIEESSSSEESAEENAEESSEESAANTEELEESSEESAASTGQTGDRLKYLPLYRAALRGDWETASRIFQDDEKAVTAKLTAHGSTALHVAALQTGRNVHFLEEFLKRVDKETLLLQNFVGDTPLSSAAIAGDTKTVTILLNKNLDALYVRDKLNTSPMTAAVMYGHRETLAYLLNVTSNNIKSYPNPFQHPADVALLNFAIRFQYFDIALDLVEKYPHLATTTFLEPPPGERLLSPLETLAKIPSAFRRGSKLRYWEGLIYDGIPLSLLESHPNKNEGDVENPTRNADEILTQTNNWNCPHLISVPPIKQIKDKKLMHNHALQLVKLICKKLEVLNDPGLQAIHSKEALLSAAQAGNPEEVERWVIQDAKEKTNKAGKTPQMIFTEEHKNLVTEGEKWMRDTANSCAIVASLIVTIVFAAAITVPGGNEDNGQPVLFKRNAFLIFAISNAISLFSSTTSLLMFLAILTSRYAEIDFLYALPRKLIIGLVTLFVSITFMIIAFSCTLYLVFGRGKNWVLIGVAILASLPVTSFVFLQFPLLVDLVSSTYGPGIFGKRSDHPFY
ncbi:hypothetical protein NMG60_11029572 [Bertholletia excelsa]